MSEWIYDPTAGRCRKTDGGKAMSDDRIAKIRARHEDNASISFIIAGPDVPPAWTLVGWMANEDRGWLLAEVEKQRADNERLTRERDEARAEVARMKKLHTPPAGIPWPAREEAKS